MLVTCRHVRQLHDAYIDGELSPSLMAEMHAHLLQCPECQREVEMTRACETVIARDRSEPELDAGFASRVVASLPKSSAPRSAAFEAHRIRRRNWWRWGASVGVPAAAAVVFFAILVWPSAERDAGPRLVAGSAVEATGVDGVVDRTLGVVTQTQETAASLNELMKIAGSEARQKAEQSARPPKAPEATALDLILVEPFKGLLERGDSNGAAPKSNDKGVVRF